MTEEAGDQGPTATDRLDPVDRDVFYSLVMVLPANQAELKRATEMLDRDAERGRFNLDRAEQVFLLAFDKCVRRYGRHLGASWAMREDYPRVLRQQLAREQRDAYVRERGYITSQRKARTGLVALLLGK